MPLASLCAPAEKHDGDGLDEDPQVEERGPVVNVFEVERDPAVEAGDVVAPADLPEAGDAGLHAESAAVSGGFDALDLVHRERSRTDEAHVAFEDVPELSEFVERGLAEEASDAGHARILFHFENRTGHHVEFLKLVALHLG